MQNTIKNKNRYDFIFQYLGILAIFLLWLLLSSINNTIFIPTIDKTFNSLIKLLSESSTYTAFGLTFYRTILAIVIALIIGIILGLLGGLFNKFNNFMKPFINLMRFIPVPCMVFIIFSVFFNALDFGSIFITLLVIFPLIYEAIAGGIFNLDESIKLSLRLEGYYRFNSIFKVLLPSTFPYLNIAIINSLGLGIKISVMSEIILGSSRIWGIGRLIWVANQEADFPKLFSIIIIIIIIFLLIDLPLNLLKKKLNIQKYNS